MGLFSGLLGNASDVDTDELEAEFRAILVEGERLERAYRVLRDLIVFTNRRMVLVDKQGMTGKKAEYHSIPYRSIVQFSKETTGHFDLEAELKIWISGRAEPIVKPFKNDRNINEVYQVLGQYVLR
jgi:hypothetical protein